MPVYFIRDGHGLVKIGSATDPRRRLQSLQIGNPSALVLAAVFDGNVLEEKALHRLFAEFRVRGEWFRESDVVAAVIGADSLPALDTPSAPTAVPARDLNIAQRIIDKCGGYRAVAEMLGVRLPAVYRWVHPRERGGAGGLVPARYQNRLFSAARAAGIPLEPADFFPDETAEAA